VPEYRGMPPGFWELYDGQSTAGITVHSVDDGLDSGDILIEGTVPIHPKDSTETLTKKLVVRGSELLAQCVTELAQGQAVGRPQPTSDCKPRTSPTRRQRLQLDKKLGIEQRHDPKVEILKTIFYLLIYSTGLFHLVRALRQVAKSSRTCILLYHRVNDLADDVLTADVERFVEQMVTLRKYYTVISSSELVGRLKSNKRLPSNSIVIHFDDCYRDVFTNASPILAQIKFPACCFVSSGYVGTERAFAHDTDKCPFGMENLRANDLIGLMEKRFEIGSHTVNHVDLGRCSYEVAVNELVQSKRDLEMILDKPVTLFSYPFGKKTNIRPEVVELVRKANYEAMFSAYGGYVTGKSDLFNLPRVGVSSRFRPLDLLMEIEGLSFGALKRRWTSKWSLPAVGDG
jgi:peptidoglycan/xylan/chitin deacetylase (PgdA/CDA1 family)